MAFNPVYKLCMPLLTKEKQQWQNIYQQKHTATTGDCRAVLDNGVAHTVIAVYYTDTQLVSN
jgi:hypothetical protein